MADFGAAAAAEAAEPPAACLSADEQALGAKRALDAALASGLPVARCAGALAEAVQAHTSLVVVGETGSGKTTLLPQLALDRVCPPIGDDGWRPRASSVVVAQPRRVAAVSVARRVAAERGRELGGEVGYAVRFDERSSRATRLKYVTDGLLLREALLDGELRRYGVAIVDEAHERTVHTDVLLGVLKRIQRERQQKWDAWQEAQVEGGMVGRGEGNGALSNGALSSPGSEASEEDEDEYVRPPLPPLKLVVMSATLDADAFLDFLGPNAGAVYVAGRSHPVEVLYTSAPEPDVLEAALLATVQIHLDEAPGGVLVFLTGQEEIESAASLLRERAKLLPAAAPPLEVLTLFAAQPPDSQQKVFEPVAEGHRRVVFATNIAETSLTLPGIKYVVDPGLIKARAFNARTGVDSLVVTPVSKDTQPPEIRRCHLASVVLQLKAMGISNVANFEFMDAPPRAAILRALEQLYALGALDDSGELSEPLGRQMAVLPLEPMAAKMVLRSDAHGCTREAIALAAMMSVDAIFVSRRAQHQQAAAARRRLGAAHGDHLTLLNVYRAFSEVPKGSASAWCRDRFVSRRALLKAQSVAAQLVGYCAQAGVDADASCGSNLEALRRCLAEGFFLHAARATPDGAYKCLANGQVVAVHPSSVLAAQQASQRPSCVIYSELVRTTKVWMRDVTAIEARWLAELAPRYYATAPATVDTASR